MSEQMKDPRQFNYVGDEQITISVAEFQTFARLAGAVLDKETELRYPEKYQYVNKETSEVIKKVTDKNQHLAVKVLDLERTEKAEPIIARTALGQQALGARIIVERIHMRNVDQGIAKHMSELQAPPAGEGVFAPKSEDVQTEEVAE